MSVDTIKEQSITDTPLLLFECQLVDGSTERWATHEVTVDGATYSGRVLTHNAFELRAGSEDGIDGASRLSLTLANADSRLSQIERSTGFRGAHLTVRFAFYDVLANATTTSPKVLFRGLANPPDLCTESKLRIAFTSRLNLHRVLLPSIRIQRRCPWLFPATAEQRALGVHGADDGKYSPYFRCGYSPDIEEGIGNRNGDTPFASCDYTRVQCEERGMFDRDSSGRVTRRFGGIEFVPASILVRGAGESTRHVSSPVENIARYNDFVPMVYGTAWFQPPIVFARNDGNLTRMEVLVAVGEIQSILKVVVNGIEIPLAQDRDMSATGWFSPVSAGNRTGNFNLDFSDAAGAAVGDPYGGMAYLSVVVPNRISDGRALPRIEVLLEGLKLSTFDSAGNYAGEAFSNNPAWVILDILRRIGWRLDGLDLASFGRTAEWCDEPVAAKDLNGNNVQIPRFQCNLVLRRRQSAAEVIRGIRNGSALLVVFGEDGRLELRAEQTLARQHPVSSAGSNSTEPLSGGWPVYEFGDGTNGFSGILRRENEESSLQVFSRSIADTPNRVGLEFQDSFNDYQQDSVSLLDAEDVILAGQEINGSVQAAGIANLDQATRIARLHLQKSIQGNTFVEFETSMKGLGILPGDLITLTYLKEGFERQLFRVVKIAPGVNFRTAKLTAQIHDDSWFGDGNDAGGRRRRQGRAETGIPRPLGGKVLDDDGNPQFLVEESAVEESDGGARLLITVGFAPAGTLGTSRAAIPVLSLGTQIDTTGGAIRGGQVLYYAVSARDSDGAESDLSFSVRALIPDSGDSNSVRLYGLSFDSDAVSMSVYRGPSPQQLDRIGDAVPSSDAYVDIGFPGLLKPPPDPNYDHANLYWRFEVLPPVSANVATARTVGNPALSLITNEHRGNVVRILTGPGAGQERAIVANDSTTLAVEPAWIVTPDASSTFVIAESSWRFGASSRTDRAEFEVPNRGGATIQVGGRSANARNEECPAELSPLTRWRLGGAAGEGLDASTPSEPVFGLFAAGDGSLEVVSVSFTELENTRSITGGTLTLHYWDELASPTVTMLEESLEPEDTELQLSTGASAVPGSYVQLGAELLEVEEALDVTRYRVRRGAFDTAGDSHAAGTPAYVLLKRVNVMPFVRDFFGSPSSGSFAFPVYLSNARVAAAELSVTNARGNSPVARQSFTFNVDNGIRTLSGEQLMLQVDGFLAIQSGAAPPAVVGGWRSVRDVFAVLREPPTGGPVVLRLLVNGVSYGDLTIPSGNYISDTINGFGLLPLADGALVGLDIISVPPSDAGSPGSDLTVTLRS